jgi:NTE family protein
MNDASTSPASRTADREAPLRRINLALQGGGSHGAFTWGVLDALLEDRRIHIDGISGASAGAVNAVALAHGLALPDMDDRRAAARASLAKIWAGVVEMGSVSALAESISKIMLGGWPSLKVSADLLQNPFSNWLSPYQTNPLNLNPLRDLLERNLDFDAIASSASPKIFVSATQVSTGKAEIFGGKRLTLDAVMASSCLPMLFKAVEIDGKAYWDGGFSSNPALLPLIGECDSRDLVLIQLNPLRRLETPDTAQEITDRINELTFNASLVSQMRAIDFINRRLADGHLEEGAKYKRLLLHRIDGGEALEDLPQSSRTSTDAAMIGKLFDMGRAAARRWLRNHWADLGEKSTINIRRDYVSGMPPEF